MMIDPLIPPDSERIPGAGVLLRGPVVAIRSSWNGAIDLFQRRDGISPSRRLRELMIMIRQESTDDSARMSRAGHGFPESTPDQAGFEQGVVTREAADLLGISPRQVRRLAPLLGGKHIGRMLIFDRNAVERATCELRNKETKTNHEKTDKITIQSYISPDAKVTLDPYGRNPLYEDCNQVITLDLNDRHRCCSPAAPPDLPAFTASDPDPAAEAAVHRPALRRFAGRVRSNPCDIRAVRRRSVRPHPARRF